MAKATPTRFLPDDVLFEIFVRLPSFDRLCSIGQVCQQWRHVSTLDSRLKKIAATASDKDELWSKVSKILKKACEIGNATKVSKILHLLQSAGALDLLERSVDDAKCDNSWTAIQYAAARGHSNVIAAIHAARSTLLDVKAKDFMESTPLLLAAAGNFGTDKAAAITTLLQLGANVAAVDKHFNTALHVAAYWGNVEAVKVLLQNGGDRLLTVHNKDSKTPLDRAVESGEYGVVELLCNDNDVATKILCASWSGSANEVQRLLDIEGSSLVSVHDQCGRTPLSLAITKDNTEVVQILWHRAKETLDKDELWDSVSCILKTACTNGDLAKVKLIVRLLSAANAADALDWVIEPNRNNALTAIHHAAQNGHVEIVTTLLDTRPELLEVGTSSDNTPLLVAAAADKFNVLDVLLKRGANIDAANEEEWTALHMAAFNGSLQSARLLLDHPLGGRRLLAVKDQDGRTPLALAKGKKSTTNGRATFSLARLLTKGGFRKEYGGVAELLQRRRGLGARLLESLRSVGQLVKT
jgi:ankyrin repeat protein